MKSKRIRAIAWQLAVFIILISCEKPQIVMFEKFKGGKAAELKEDVIIPFNVQSSHIIEVTATIKDKPYKMVVDTGGMTMLEKSANDTLKFETIEIPQQNATLAIVNNLQLGNASVKGMKVGLIDFKDNFKFELPGMIGSDYLRFFNVEFDYQKQNITLRNPAKIKTENDLQHLIKIRMIQPYFPAVDLFINRKHKSAGMIDTGMSYAFVFPIDWLDNLSDNEKENLLNMEGYFLRWPWMESPRNYLYLMPEIKLGDLVLENVPVLLAEIPDFLNISTALIGKYFLENYLTTIDFPNRQIKFENREKSNYSLRYSAGIHLAKKEGKLQITGVLENSPAWEAGISPSDELIAINGKNFEEISKLEITDAIMDKTIAKFYITVLRKGIEEEILLKKRDLFD